ASIVPLGAGPAGGLVALGRARLVHRRLGLWEDAAAAGTLGTPGRRTRQRVALVWGAGRAGLFGLWPVAELEGPVGGSGEGGRLLAHALLLEGGDVRVAVGVATLARPGAPVLLADLSLARLQVGRHWSRNEDGGVGPGRHPDEQRQRQVLEIARTQAGDA